MPQSEGERQTGVHTEAAAGTGNQDAAGRSESGEQGGMASETRPSPKGAAVVVVIALTTPGSANAATSTKWFVPARSPEHEAH